MKLKFLMVLGVIAIGTCLYVNSSLSDNIMASTNKSMRFDADEEYKIAAVAMDGIYQSIEIIEQNDKEIVISMENSSEYNFHSMMVNAQFVNERGVPYHIETAFLTDGLMAGTKCTAHIEITAPEMLEELDWINFYTEGF